MTAAPGNQLDLAWNLHERVAAAFRKPLESLRLAVEKAAEPPELVAASEPAKFQRACLQAMTAVTDFAQDANLPNEIRDALRGLSGRYQEMLLTLQPAWQAIAAAAPDLRNIAHIEGMAGMLFQATQAANPSTPVGVAAIGGATLGTLVMPGIGTAIGGALGVLLGGTQANRRDRRALDRYVEAVKMMWAATEDLHVSVWSHLVHALPKTSTITLPDAAFFEAAQTRWTSLKETQAASFAAGEPAPVRAAVEAFLRDWGPHADALVALAQTCLPPLPLDLVPLGETVRRQEQVYPNDARTCEARARFELESGNFAAALEAAERGLAKAANHAGLRLARLEALAALGRQHEAEAELLALRPAVARPGQPPAAPVSFSIPPGEGEQALLRGLMRGGRKTEAAECVRAWVQRDAKPAWIAQQLRAFTLTAPLVDEAPELAAIPNGPAGLLQALVERYLGADGKSSFFGEAPADKGRNARSAFLNLQPDEKVLFFHDWSLWHNGKAGLALTTRRLLWKAGWDQPGSIDLAGISGSPITSAGSIVHVGSNPVDVENDALAAELAQVLRDFSAFREKV
jgi:hypothetical protein